MDVRHGLTPSTPVQCAEASCFLDLVFEPGEFGKHVNANVGVLPRGRGRRVSQTEWRIGHHEIFYCSTFP